MILLLTTIFFAFGWQFFSIGTDAQRINAFFCYYLSNMDYAPLYVSLKYMFIIYQLNIYKYLHTHTQLKMAYRYLIQIMVIYLVLILFKSSQSGLCN